MFKAIILSKAILLPKAIILPKAIWQAAIFELCRVKKIAAGFSCPELTGLA
ncbi:MAG: hypothetical protein ACRD82_00665 [Blastocatellia bacterium]